MPIARAWTNHAYGKGFQIKCCWICGLRCLTLSGIDSAKWNSRGKEPHSNTYSDCICERDVCVHFHGSGDRDSPIGTNIPGNYPLCKSFFIPENICRRTIP